MEAAPSAESPTTAQFAELGCLLLEAGFSATDTRESLEAVRDRIAPEHELSFAVLPEAVFVAPAGTAGGTVLRMTLASTMSTRQSAMTSRMVQRLRVGTTTLQQALGPDQRRMRAAKMHMPASRWVGGSALIAAGLAVLFRCPWWAVLVAAIVAVIVGVVTAALQRVRPAAAIVPFLIAFLSTVLVSEAAALLGFSSVPLFAVCAPIAILVPGAMITNALLELTAADIVTGASRLIYGLVQLGFMVAGIAAGGAVIGLRIDQDSVVLLADAVALVDAGAEWAALPPVWFAWVGVVALAVGISIAFGAGFRLTAVAMVAMAVTYALLVWIGPFWGSIVATGVAGATLFVVARLFERSGYAIPAPITFQPAFLLLVPGTVGLVALASLDLDSVASAPATFVSLCIGVKLGSVVIDTHWWRIFRRESLRRPSAAGGSGAGSGRRSRRPHQEPGHRDAP